MIKFFLFLLPSGLATLYWQVAEFLVYLCCSVVCSPPGTEGWIIFCFLLCLLTDPHMGPVWSAEDNPGCPACVAAGKSVPYFFLTPFPHPSYPSTINLLTSEQLYCGNMQVQAALVQLVPPSGRSVTAPLLRCCFPWSATHPSVLQPFMLAVRVFVALTLCL